MMNNNNQSTTANSGNNSNSNSVYTPTINSGYTFYNSESNVDKTLMSISYWNGLLKVMMNPINVSEGSAPKVDTSTHIEIYLTPAKAHLFLHAIREFRKDPSRYTNISVPTNKGAIAIVNGDNAYGVSGTFITITLINQDVEVTASAAYHISVNNYFTITDFEPGKTFDKDTSYSNQVELNILETILDQYVKAFTNAIAASVIDNNKYNNDRSYKFMNDVRNKLGIPVSNKSSNKYNTSNWQRNASNGSTEVSSSSADVNEASLDDVMNDIASSMLDD